MDHSLTTTGRLTAEQYREVSLPVADGGLRLLALGSLVREWIVDSICEPSVGAGRQHRTIGMPNGGTAFVKTYNPRAKHSLWRRLRSSRAIAEGRGYLAFAAAGIETPELLAWGEVRRRGLWMRGIVVTRLIDGPTVAEEYSARRDEVALERAVESLARIHRAGLAHGDPRLRNFLLFQSRVLPFDLCSWGRISESHRREDLVKFLGSALTLVERPVAEKLLAMYSECAGWRAGDGLMDDAELYARKERVP